MNQYSQKQLQNILDESINSFNIDKFQKALSLGALIKYNGKSHTLNRAISRIVKCEPDTFNLDFINHLIGSGLGPRTTICNNQSYNTLSITFKHYNHYNQHCHW